VDDLAFTVELVLRAGEIIKAGWQQDWIEIEHKGQIDPVTEVDRRSEVLILRELKSAYPDFGILSEESPEQASRRDARWIVDPLDGTTNFIKQIPLIAVSIGLEISQELVLGVVHNPLTGELFCAQKGSGATLNGSPIHISSTSEVSKAVLASGFPYNAWDTPDDNTTAWSRLVKRAFSLRCDGSAALDLCQVACGRFDGYWERGLSPWDMAAGIVIAREAGARVTDLHGGNQMLARGEVLAASPAIAQQIQSDL
jgi:myo-inositol-1(or 4)-monophosphatase